MTNINRDYISFFERDLYGDIDSDWYNYRINELFDWCEKNCTDNFGFTNQNTWCFVNEFDSIQFVLRWQ